MKEALFYEKTADHRVRCMLCPHSCIIPEGGKGLCAVRQNRGGILYSLVYGKAVAEHIDPIEKKPLFHFLPGTRSLSIATVGCNLSCRHCQNSDISQMPRDDGIIAGRDRDPQMIVDSALSSGCQSISFTYTEPTVYFEYAYETAELSSARGLKNVFVTNGYTCSEPLKALHPYLDAANIDLKSFSDDFYRKICGARLQPVLDAILFYRELGIWIEITTLIIPDLNDSYAELEQIAGFIAGLGAEIPWHVTAFYPTYRLTDRMRTPSETLLQARDIGLRAGLRYVYTGNVPGVAGENTCCPGCGTVLIRRLGFQVAANRITGGRCPECASFIDGVNMDGGLS